MNQDEFPEYTPRQPGAPMALEGVRVVEFAHFIAGPFAATLLANFGADVIKVEAPGRGDEFRYLAPPPPPTSGPIATSAASRWTSKARWDCLLRATSSRAPMW